MSKKKTNRIYEGLVPFLSDGSLVDEAMPEQSFVNRYDDAIATWIRRTITWKPNFVFDDGLAVVSCESTGWSNYFELKSVNDNIRYVTPVKNMPHIFSLASIYQQEIDGVWRLVLACHWTFKKHADKYFVTAVDPEQIK